MKDLMAAEAKSLECELCMKTLNDVYDTLSADSVSFFIHALSGLQARLDNNRYKYRHKKEIIKFPVRMLSFGAKSHNMSVIQP